MRVLSIDVGTKNLGWAAWDEKIVDVGVVDLSKYKGDYASQVHKLMLTGFLTLSST